MLAFLLVLFADKAELIQGTAGSRSDDLSLQAGGLVLHEGKPGAAFGTVQGGTGKRQLAYFLVIKHRWPGEGKTESNEDVSVEALTGTAKHNLSIDGKALPLVYTVALDGKTKKPKAETLMIGGKMVDLAKGRVLLVDMTADPPKWEQRKLDLPAEVGDLSTNKAASALAKEALDMLLKDAKVKGFVRAAD
jgi:hypothetical protein